LKADREIFKFIPKFTEKGDALAKQASEIEDTYALPWSLRAWAQFNRSRYLQGDKAATLVKSGLGFAKRALELDPQSPFANMAKAVLLLKDKKLAEALSYGQKAISIAPNLPDLQAQYSVILRFNGHYARAIDTLERARRLHPRHPFWYIQVQGLNLVFAGRYEDVIAHWQDNASKIPNYHYFHLSHLAIANAALGRIEAAKSHIEKLQKRLGRPVYAGLWRTMFPIKDRAVVEDRIALLIQAGMQEYPPGKEPKPAIAVLPFANLSDDKEQEYFADGMTDDLITDLSKLSGLIVIARNSVFTYKGKAVKVQEVAKDLNVTHVLEGSVSRAEGKVRINAKLIDAKTGAYLWAEKFDRDFTDIFALQDEVTGDIVAALKVKLTPGEQNKLAGKPTDNLDAYDAFLNGWSYFLRRTPKDYALALTWLEKAVALDPAFGQAWAALAALYHEAIQRNWDIELAIDPKKLKFLLDKALAHPTPLALQVAAESAGQDTSRIFAYLDQASALDPNNADTYMIRALMTDWSGNAEEAIRLAEKSVQLDPHHTAHNLYVLGRAQYSAGKSEQAIRTLRRAMARNESDYFPLIFLTAAYAAAGRLEEAKASAENLIERRHELGLENTWVGDFSASYKDQNMNLAADLIAAGISETLSLGQLNLTTKDRITGSALTKHIFGMKAEGRANGGIWTHLRDHQGRTKHLWNGQHIADSVDRIENDKLIMEGPKLNPQRLECAQYRNAKGSKTAYDEYVGVCLSGVYPYAAFPLPR